MFCSNCGKKNDDNSKFCSDCGNVLENNISNNTYNNQNIPNYYNNPTPTYNVPTNTYNVNNKKKVPVLSWVSLSLLLTKVLISIIVGIVTYNYTYNYSYNSYSGLSIFSYLPLLTASLVTSIVSRVKNKDTMSLVVMIVDIVLIALAIIIVIIFIAAFSSFIYACSNY